MLVGLRLATPQAKSCCLSYIYLAGVLIITKTPRGAGRRKREGKREKEGRTRKAPEGHNRGGLYGLSSATSVPIREGFRRKIFSDCNIGSYMKHMLVYVTDFSSYMVTTLEVKF